MGMIILDTNVYIGHWERGLYQERVQGIRRRDLIGHSAVVLSALRRGARPMVIRRLASLPAIRTVLLLFCLSDFSSCFLPWSNDPSRHSFCSLS